MRLASPLFFRRVASMSSNYNRRGAPRPYRGYSSRPSPPPAYGGAGAELVSGDAHLGAVHDASDSLRRGGGVRAPPQQYGHGPHSQPPPYGYGQQQRPIQPYGAVPYNYSHPQPPLSGPHYGTPHLYGNGAPNQYGYGTPNQYGHGTPNQYGQGHPPPYWCVPPPNAGFPPANAGFRPGAPRLADYRRAWRFAKQQPPHQSEKFRVLSYNILADYLAQEHRDLYERIPSYIMNWNWRKEKLIFEFGLWSPDILCLQEVDRFTDLEQKLSSQGYSGIWKMRTGNAVDGCAIFWRTARFQLRYEEGIEFNKLGLRDNVAQLCVLESVGPRNVQINSDHISISPSHPQQAKQVVVCNTHVLYNPKRGDIKLGQVRTLLHRADTISKMWNDAPVILCGDFNSTPKSPLYNFILEQKLNLSGITRYAMSGQQSSDSQGLYIDYNISRFRPPFHVTNGRVGNIGPLIGPLNDHKPQSEAKNMGENSYLAGKEPLLADTSSKSCFNSESRKSFDNKVPCSGSTNLDEQGSLSSLVGPAKEACSSDSEAHANKTMSVDNSSEKCIEGIKIESIKKSGIGVFPYAPTTVSDEILQSYSSEAVDNRHLLCSYESSGLKDSVEESLGVNTKASNTQGDLSGHEISEDLTCPFDGNSVQLDVLLDVSKDNHAQKEKGHESMSDQNNCTTRESNLSQFSGSDKFTDALHQMSNLKLEEENNTGTTPLTSSVEPMHQSYCATSDAFGNQCTPGVDKHSDSYSCQDESGNGACAFGDDDAPVNVTSCSDVNSDPSFFKECFGGNECLQEFEDQQPTTSDGSSSAHKVFTPQRYYYNDPYRWTADEIKAATGNEECTYVEHDLKVRSVYTDVEDFDGTKDVNKDPLVTSYHRKFMGTVDYIWASEDLQTVKVLDTFSKEILKQTIGFPTKKWASDHIALVCELAFKK